MTTTLHVQPDICDTCKGHHLIPAGPRDGAALEKLTKRKIDPQRPYACNLTRPRNRKVHNLYFAACEAAAHHWPDGEEPEPNGDGLMLRKWLQCEAGHCIVSGPWPVSHVAMVISLLEAAVKTGDYAFIKTDLSPAEPTITVLFPKSISKDALPDDAQFEALKTKVIARIESTIGTDVKTLVEMHAGET